MKQSLIFASVSGIFSSAWTAILAPTIAALLAAILAWFITTRLDGKVHRPKWHKQVDRDIPKPPLKAAVSEAEWEELVGEEPLETIDFDISYPFLPDHQLVTRTIRREILVRKKPCSKVPLIFTPHTLLRQKPVVKELDGRWGKVTEVKPKEDGSMLAYFRFDDVVPVGGRRVIEYSITQPIGKREVPNTPNLAIVSPALMPIRRATIHITFNPNEMPEEVWRAWWPNGIAYHSDKPHLLEELEPESGTTYSSTFFNLEKHSTYKYGIWWRW